MPDCHEEKGKLRVTMDFFGLEKEALRTLYVCPEGSSEKNQRKGGPVLGGKKKLLNRLERESAIIPLKERQPNYGSQIVGEARKGAARLLTIS